MNSANPNMPQEDEPHTENPGEETGILRDPDDTSQALEEVFGNAEMPTQELSEAGALGKTDFLETPTQDGDTRDSEERMPTETLGDVESMPTQEIAEDLLPESGILSPGLSLENPMGQLTDTLSAEQVTDALSPEGTPTAGIHSAEVPTDQVMGMDYDPESMPTVQVPEDSVSPVLTEADPGLSTSQIPAGDAPTSFLDESADTEEVYVILPEGEDEAIPIIETQVVEEGEEAEAEAVGMTEMLEEPAPATEEFTIVDDESSLEAESPVYHEGSDHLDQIASDLDEELLASHAGGDEEGFSSLEGEDIDYAALAEGAEWGEDEEAASGGGRSRRKVLLSVAALLLVAAGAVYYFQFYLQDQGPDSGGVAFATSSGSSTPGSTGENPDPGAGGVDGSAGGPDGSTGTDPGDPVVLARDVFHEKFLLAVELGFAGEVGNE